MLQFVLVLLVASSALAAPSVSVSQYSINEVSPVADNGKLVSSFLTDRLFEFSDGGDTNIYILTLQQIINDLSNQNDPRAQALSLAQSIALLGELAYGVPGDSCDAAAVIDSYASGRGNGQSVRTYINRLASNIDVIAQLAVNPNSLRYATGPRGNCAGSGRTYQFEAAWDAILNSASPYNLPLLNEEYCAAKRLYSAFNIRSNSVGAGITAASLEPVVSVVQGALAPLAQFLRVVVNGGNASASAAVAKQALLA